MDERALTERLITYDTSQPDGIRACAGFIKGWLESREIDVHDSVFGGLPVLTAAVGPLDAPTIIFHGHLDVVPGHAEQFTPRIEGDRLYGRGAYDMKGSVAAMMCALRDLAEQDKVRVRFVCVPDEESEDIDTRSIDDVVRGGFTGDFAITGEPTDLHVGVQAKGVLAFRLHVHGRSAHGSTPWLGDNAVLKAIDVFRRIESLPFSRESSELFDRPSVNLGRIQGGDALNKVPDLCQMVVDIRYLPNQDPGDILEQIRSIPDIEVVKTFTRVPAYVSRSQPVRRRAGRRRRPAHPGRVDERRPRRRLGRGLLPGGGHPRGRVRPRGRGPPRAGGVGVDLLARALPPGAVRLRDAAARVAARSRARAARRRGRAGVSPEELLADEAPPRPGRGLIWRTLLAGVLICLATAGAVSATVLLQVDDGARRARARRAARRSRSPRSTATDAGEAQTLMILGSDIRYQDREAAPAALGHHPARPPGPGQGGDRDDLDPPRPPGRRSPASATSVKINDAYAEGGERLAVRTIKELLSVGGRDFKINHVVTVDFGGFQQAINYIDCVYADIDRDYFNDNTGPGGYAAIDIDPGYQKLCGKDALAYVRYRHNDNDLVRAARQQDFLRQVRTAKGTKKLMSGGIAPANLKKLARVFGRYFDRDKSLDSAKEIFRFAKTVLFTAGNPVNEVQFRVSSAPDNINLVASEEQLEETVSEFLDAKASAVPRATEEPSDEDVARSEERGAPEHQGAVGGPRPRAEPHGRRERRHPRLAPGRLPVLLPDAADHRGGVPERGAAHLQDQGRARQEARRVPDRREEVARRRRVLRRAGHDVARPADPRRSARGRPRRASAR